LSRQHQIKQYLNYRRKSISKYKAHSPFVFDFITKVLNDNTKYDEFSNIELYRKKLIKNHNLITVKDLGAGSLVDNSTERKISHISKNALVSKKDGQLLYKIARYFQPKTILELGTSFGVSSAYLSKGAKNGTLTTIEGCSSIHQIALQTFKELNITNVNSVCANFDTCLTNIIESLSSIDLVFIDGNHTEAATINYFNLILPKLNPNSILIFDDIYWSEEMTNAWETIKKSLKVSLTIDVFSKGLVFFGAQIEKQHFVLKYH